MNIAKYIEEMSWVTKIVWGSLFAVIVGFIATSGWESPQEKQSMAYLRGREITVEYAREACKKGLKNHLSSDIGDYPMQSNTDPMATAATLTWRGDGKEFTAIVCNYHKDKGLTSLSIDGVEKLSLSAASLEADSKSGKTVEAAKAVEKPAEKTETVETP
ncbi:MAG: hypothetical protein ACREV4_09175 [Gammaproteobacteria bacterium]